MWNDDDDDDDDPLSDSVPALQESSIDITSSNDDVERTLNMIRFMRGSPVCRVHHI